MSRPPRPPRFRRAAATLAAALATLALPVLARAQTIPNPALWFGGNDNWVDLAVHWGFTPDVSNPFLVYPDNNLAATDYGFQVLINDGAPTVNTPLTISSLTLGASGGLNINGFGSLVVEGLLGVPNTNFITNDSLIHLTGNGGITGGFLSALIVNGVGTIHLDGDATTLDQFTALYQGGGHLIRGTGSIGSLYSSVINQSTIRIDESGELRLRGVLLDNSAQLRASGGGIFDIDVVQFNNTGSATVTAQQGAIRIDATDLRNSSLVEAKNQGNIQFTGTDLDNSGGTLRALTADADPNGGHITFRNGSALRNGLLITDSVSDIAFVGGTNVLSGTVTSQARVLVSNSTLTIPSLNYQNSAGVFELAAGGSALATGATTWTGGVLRGVNAFPITSTLEARWDLTLDGGPGVTLQNFRLFMNGQGSGGQGTATLTGLTGVTNHGLIELGNSARFVAGTPAYTFGGSGTLRGGDFTGNAPSQEITGPVGGTITNTATHTLAGVFRLGSSQIDLVNDGVITADSPTGKGIQFQFTGRTLTNNHLILAANSGVLFVDPGLYDNRAGTIRATDSALIQLRSGAVIRGGLLETLGSTAKFKTDLGGALLDGSFSGGITLRGRLENNASSIQTAPNGLFLKTVLHNDGLITSDLAGIGVQSSAFTFDGSGTVRFSNNINGGAPANRISLPTGGVLTNETGHTLGGAFVVLGENAWSLVNRGHILADSPTGNPVQFTLNGQSLTHAGGTFRSTGGGRWSLLGTGQVYNTGQTLVAEAGSTGELGLGIRVHGGTLRSEGNGYLFVSATTGAALDGSGPDGITLAGNLKVPATSSTLTLRDSLTNLALVEVDRSLVQLESSTSIGGTGTFRFSDVAQVNGIPVASLDATNAAVGSTLTIGSGQTFAGVVNLGVGELNFVNAGTLQADSPGGRAFLIGLENARTLTNTGTLRATGGGGLYLSSGTVNNAGGTLAVAPSSYAELRNTTALTGGSVTIAPAGTLALANGNIAAATTTSSSGGVIRVVSSTTGNTLGGTVVNPLGGRILLLAGGPTSQDPATTLKLPAGTALTNAGTFELAAKTSLSLSTAGTVTFTGGGSLIAADAVNPNGFPQSGVSATVAGVTLVNAAGHTIRGVLGLGSLGTPLDIQNAGLILADSPLSHYLLISPGALARTFTNTGIVRAAGGRIGLDTATVDNAAGLIEALADSEIELRGSVLVQGGTLSSTGNGYLYAATNNSPTLDGLTRGPITFTGSSTNGTYLVSNQTTDVKGEFINQGRISITAGGGLRLVGSTTFSGSGDVVLDNASGGNGQPANYIIQSSGTTHTLVNAAGHTLHGVGGINGPNIVNAGLIAGDGPINRFLTVDVSGGRTLTNTGTLRGGPLGTLGLIGAVNNAGGRIECLPGGSVALVGDTTIRGGTLATTGDGFIYGGAPYRPNLDGVTAGPIALTGLYRSIGTGTFLRGTLTNTGTLRLENGQLYLNGATTLAGGGTVELTGGTGNVIQGFGASYPLINENLIRGSGTIGGGITLHTNRGTIQADNSAQHLLLASSFTNEPAGLVRGLAAQIDLNTGTLTQNGTFEGRNGGIVIFSTAALANYTAATRTLTGGTWRCVSTGGGGSYILTQSRPIRVNAATIELSGPQSIFDELTGTLAVNQGTLILGEGRAVTTAGPLDNTGTILIRTGASLTVPGAFTNAVGATITVTGAGSVLTLNGSAINRGTLIISGGATLNAAPGFTNAATGTLDVLTGHFTPPAGFINQGLIIDAGQARIKSIDRAPDGVAFAITIEGLPGHTYQMQRSTDLAAEVFTDLGPPRTLAAGASVATLTFTDPAPPAPRAFYRIVVGP